MRIGLDFGTTHSGAAFFDGARVQLVPLDPASLHPGVMRSAMYITRDHQRAYGQRAIDLYYEQNIGRPSRLIQQYVGEIEMAFGEVGAVKGYPVSLPTIVREVYVLIDELTPGRLLYSLKGELASDYQGSTLFGRSYSLEELIGAYLAEVRQRVEAHVGQPVRGVVLGRPVRFAGAETEEDDAQAERRLRRAADLAGFEDVAFELEPVAAALHYESTAARPQHIVVFDLGGGTLDITVMRVGGAERRVYATGGLGIGGDVFDQRIIHGALLEHFGQGSTWGEDAIPFPSHYTEALATWQSVPELNRPETLNFLQLVQRVGSHPVRIRALESLLVNNYAIRLLDAVERAKVALSTAVFTLIRLAGEDLNVWQPLTRAQFEALIADAATRIEACLLDTVARSGLPLTEIDVVVRTGGSAQVPWFAQMLQRIFGPEKVVLADVFTSVTAGLAIRAHSGPR